MRRIGLLGATGYTGRLVATEFAVREIDVRLGARSAERLKEVDGTEASERVVVDTTDPRGLASFMTGLDVVISTVGPFALLGHPVAAAAVAAGVHYIDSTGEPTFMQELYDRYDAAATAVVPACGVDFLPGDCATAVAAGALDDPVDRILVGYSMKGIRPTRGTAMSAIEAASREASPRLRRTEVEGHPAVELPWGEAITIPRWAPDAAVSCAITAPRVATMFAPLAGPATGPLMRATAPLLRRIAGRLPEGPDEQARAAASTRIVATASAPGRSATVTVELKDIYAFTALALVESALRVEGAGALTPSQASDPAAMLDALRGPLMSWTPPAAS